MKHYQVVLTTGQIIDVPRDRSRTQYENVKRYGLPAVLERARRTLAYREATAHCDARIRAIVTPQGSVTQF